jgi:hypothetical protein
MLGRAGIGYPYLRQHDSSVPSILSPDPVMWGIAPKVWSKSYAPTKERQRRIWDCHKAPRRAACC